MKRVSVLAVAALFVLAACTTVNVTPEGQQAATTSTASTAATGDTAKSNPFRPWDTALKDTRPIEGMIKLHLKRDQTLFAELRPEQLGKEFGLIMHFSRGVGDFDLNDGLYLGDTRLVRFHRVGDQIHMIHVNPRMIADEGSPMKASLEDNVGHSIAGVFKIESENEQTKNLLVNITDFFVSDYANVGNSLKYYFQQKPVEFEKEKSYVEGVMGFPQNVEIDAALSFKAPEYPTFGAEAVSDYRSIPLAIRYSLIELPQQPMQPRISDDRVGHFVDAMRDFSRDQQVDPYVRYVNRWRLEKKDPNAAISEPVKPITFYIDHSVPKEYRKYVKEGIEGWNKAFEAAGFKNAVVALEAPNDSTWSAEDARYSTIRWTAAYRMGYAIGPSQTDPRTGEILNADILVSSEFTNGWADLYQQIADPDAFRRMISGYWMQPDGVSPHARHRLCVAEMGLTHQFAFQHTMLAGMGVIEGGKPMPEEFLGEGIRWLILHEVGHTLGLRHNFKSSAGIPYDKLHDKDYTRQHGVYLSVMDYPPVNIAVDPSGQGHYWNPEVGSYDVWAIEYAYTPIFEQTPDGPLATSGMLAKTPEAELAGLHKIAAQVADPLHAYNTDEDNWLGPYAVDPLTNANDLGSNPLQYARDRAALVARVQPSLESRLIADGEGYQRLRDATTGLLFERVFALLPVTKTVGGIHFARDHKGDPDQRPTFTPVPADQQREAVRLIVDGVFAPDAFDFDPELLNKLAPNRHSHWGMGSGNTPVDYPVHGYVNMLQGVMLGELFHPGRLQRMIDNEVRMPDGSEPYQLSELFSSLTSAVWQETEPSNRPQSIDSFRRNLQRTYTDQLVRLLMNAPPYMAYGPNGPYQVSVPEHARSLARLELMDLSNRIEQILESNTGLDRDTQAHLVESNVRIDKALDASLTVPMK